MNSLEIDKLVHKSEETEVLVLNLHVPLGSELVPNHLTKIPFDHMILEDRQSILLLLLTICWAYTPTYTPTKKCALHTGKYRSSYLPNSRSVCENLD